MSNLNAAIEELAEIKRKLEELGAQESELVKRQDELRFRVIPDLMTETGTEVITLAGVGRVNLRAGLKASIPEEARDDAYEWLRDNNHGDIIRPSVPVPTLVALIKTLIKKGESIPEGLFRVYHYTEAVLTRRGV